MQKSILNYIIYLLVFLIISCLIYMFFIKRDENIKPKELVIENNNITMDINDQEKIIAYVKNADKYTLTYESLNPNIATVSSNGVIKALMEGEVVIKVEYKDGNTNLEEDCVVNVIDNRIKVNDVIITEGDLVIKENSEYKLSFDVEPSNADVESVLYKASNENIRVSSDGVITALKKGKSMVSIIVNNNVQKDINVYVTNLNITNGYMVLPTSIELSNTSVDLTEGDEKEIKYWINDKDADKKYLSWTSSNDLVATINDGKIKAIKEGTAVIKLSSVNNVSASLTVNVKAKPVDILVEPKPVDILIGEISITSKTNITIKHPTTSQITYQISPSNATNPMVTFESTNPNVLTVSDTGLITTVHRGSAEVIVSSSDGGNKSARIKVEVYDNTSGVNNSCAGSSDATFASCFKASPSLIVNRSTVNLRVGESTTVRVTIPTCHGSNINVTRRSPGGETGYGSYVSQSNGSLSGLTYDWNITAKRKGQVLLSQTVQFDATGPDGCRGNIKSMIMITVNIS